jgi:tRNA (guanine37-N1)-methyltransferase
MKIDILTLFPEMFDAIKHSILFRAEQKGLLEINTINIRDFSADKHKKVDDTPFGGGAGMVMTCQPLFDAINSVKAENSTIVYMSPRGEILNQQYAISLSSYHCLSAL